MPGHKLKKKMTLTSLLLILEKIVMLSRKKTELLGYEDIPMSFTRSV